MGVTTPVSLFSFGPLAVTFFDHPFLIFFFNQLSIFTALIIALQVRFIRSFRDINPRTLYLIIIAIHIVMALLTAVISILPHEEWYLQLVEGGAFNE